MEGEKMKRIIAGFLAGLIMASGVAFASVNEVRIFVDGREVISDVPAQIIDGRTMVPLRFVAEEMGAKVYWDETGEDWGFGKRTVVISTKEEFQPAPEPEQRIEKPKEEFQPAPEPEQRIEKLTGRIGQTLEAEGLKIRIDNVRYSKVHPYHDDTKAGTIAPDGMEFAIVSFTIINENATPDSWATVSNWGADAYENHARYEEWLKEWSYHVSTNRMEVSNWIYEGERLSSEICFWVFEGMKLKEIHYKGIPDVEIVFIK